MIGTFVKENKVLYGDNLHTKITISITKINDI